MGKMRRIGYVRVSSLVQNLDRQIAALRAERCNVIFREIMSGKSMKSRSELEKAIDELGTGDVLIVAELDRATRSMFDGIEVIKRINDRGALIKVLDKPRGFFPFLPAMSEDERQRILARCSAGRELPSRTACGSAQSLSSPTISGPKPSSVWPPAKVAGRSQRSSTCTTLRSPSWRARGRLRGPIGAAPDLAPVRVWGRIVSVHGVEGKLSCPRTCAIVLRRSWHRSPLRRPCCQSSASTLPALPFEPTSGAEAPAAGELLVLLLQPLVSCVVHARRLLWEIVETVPGFNTPSLLEPLPDVPTHIANAQRFAFVLGFVPGTLAKAAPKTDPAIDNAAAAPATRTGEPMPDAAEMHRRRHDRDQLVNGVGAAAGCVVVLEPKPSRLEAIANRAGFHAVTRPLDRPIQPGLRGPWRLSQARSTDLKPVVFRRGSAPHCVKVCITKKGNEAAWPQLLGAGRAVSAVLAPKHDELDWCR